MNLTNSNNIKYVLIINIFKKKNIRVNLIQSNNIKYVLIFVKKIGLASIK